MDQAVIRLLTPAATPGLKRHWWAAWSSTDGDSAFQFDLSSAKRDAQRPFVCVFLIADPAQAAPKIAFDHGEGFDDVSAISFLPFPLAFYHVSLATMGAVRGMRFRPCRGPGRFRFIAFRTGQPLLVAILHFLFNLRYQKIGLVAAAPRGRRDLRTTVTANVRRIAKFFADVSAGSGVRVQQVDDDVLMRLKLAQSLQVVPVRQAMAALLAERHVPLLSFVAPTFDTPPDYLRDLLKSFAAEQASYAELILVDDGSTRPETLAALDAAEAVPGVRVIRNAANGGIAVATNTGIAATRGDWVAFIDHDDAFVAGAIAIIAQAITDHSEADFFYTDEIIANGALEPIGSFCKPSFDSVLLSGQNYINHFSVFRRARLQALGGLRLDREGSQDYDLLLRYLDAPKPGTIVHIPFLAYLWRRVEHSYSSLHRDRSVANARAALRCAYADRSITVEPADNADFHRVRFPNAAKPLVSVIIPNRDSLALITRIIADLRTRTTYPDIEIIMVDNGTTDADVLAFYARQDASRFTLDLKPEPFDFAGMCNRGAARARGDLLLFLNNDIEVREADWLAEMVECLSFADTGIVGAKLLYPGGTIQHAGVIVGLGEAAGHWYVEDPADEPGPMGRLAVRQTMTAVTGACMLVTRACFEAVSGFDAAAFPIAYNDIDLCIRARQAGFRTIWTPFAVLTHHESLSRGSDETEANTVRFQTEMGRLKARHGTETFIDEAFSPFYDRRYSRPHLILPDALPASRINTLG